MSGEQDESRRKAGASSTTTTTTTTTKTSTTISDYSRDVALLFLRYGRDGVAYLVQQLPRGLAAGARGDLIVMDEK